MTAVATAPAVVRVGKDDLRRLFSDLDVVKRVASVLGIPPVGLDEPFGRVLHGHDPQDRSATLRRNRKGVIVYHDQHKPGATKVYTLPQVYFAQRTSKEQRLRGPTHAVWALDLLRAAGILRPVDDVGLADLPDSASPTVQRVYMGFRRLLAVKWTYETGAQPVAFSWRFGAAWCNVSEHQAGEAIRELLRLKIIHIAKHIPGRFDKRMALFMPGPGRTAEGAASSITSRHDDEGA